MSRPSQIFLMVEMVVLLLRPPTILFKVDWVSPLIVANLLTVMLFSVHSSRMRSLTASPMDKFITSKQVSTNILTVLSYKTYLK